MSINVAAEFWPGEEGNRLRDVFGRGEAGHRGAAFDIFVGVASAGLAFFVDVGSKTPNILATL